jgi:iron complex outermembrane receptor protein
MWTAVGARALTNEWGERALVLIDGQEVNLEVFGIALWQSFSAHLEDIERIEVIRGPGSALYGANAHSLVVSITTRTPTKDSAEAFLWGGEHGHLGTHLRLAKIWGKLRLQLSGGQEFSGHWQQRGVREADIARFRLQADYESELGTSSLRLGVSTPNGRVFAILFPGTSDNALNTNLLLQHRNDFFQARVTLGIIQADVHLDLPLFFKDISLGSVREPMQIFSSNLDAQVEITWSPVPSNLLIAGTNYRWITYLSEQNDPKSTNQHRIGVFLHDEQRIGERLVLTGGIRFDYNNITPIAVSPRLALVWQFAEEQFLRVAFGRAFRKPSFFNTTAHLTNIDPSQEVGGVDYFFRNSLGNDKLNNESVTSLEAGYVGRFLEARLMAEADVFYNRYRNTINLHADLVTNMGVPDLGNSTLLFENLGMEADSVGGSLSLTYRIKKSLRMNVNYTLRYSWYTSDPAVTSAGSSAKKGDRVAWEPVHQANVCMHYLTERGLRLGASLHFVSSKEVYLKEDGDLFKDFVRIENPSHWFMSGFIAWRASYASHWIEAGIRAYDLLNAPFRDRSSVVRPNGTEDGGELINRRISFYLRGTL